MNRKSLILLAVLACSVSAWAQNSIIGGKNKVRHDEFDWKVYETPHFRISYYDRVEPNLEKIASYAESSYDELARRLNFQILEPVPLLTYATHAEFEQTNVMVNFIPEGVGAFATPVRNRMVLPVDLGDKDLEDLIKHELTHIFQYEILFQGRRGRALFRRPPQWFMEGMASYFADDEDARAQAFMRDAALSDRIPSIAQPVGGYFAYRFGHKIFEFVEAEWGEDGVRDFVFAFRNTLGGQIQRPLMRVLNMDVEEFDGAFRGWLRKQYAEHADRQTAREMGREFHADRFRSSQEVSPVASPSGDLIAAFTTAKDDVDVAIFGAPDRYFYRNLTKGYTAKYEYLIAQHFTVGGVGGPDLAFSPDGNQVAVFARTERTRSILLLDVKKGGVARRINIDLPIDQASQPAWSPDGRSIVFKAVREGQHDIFEIDLESEVVRNLTNDESFDASPVYTPDGESIVYTAKPGELGKLVELHLDGSDTRRQLTFGPGNDEGPSYSADGNRLYFASDRDGGVLDIYFIDLEKELLFRLTRVIGAAVNPAPISTLEGERVVFQAFSRGGWKLYVTDPNLAENLGPAEPARVGIDLEPYLPAVSISVDPDKGIEVGRRKMYIEDARALIGVDQDSNLISQMLLTWADQYGDRRFVIVLNSIDTFSNFRISWNNIEERLQWGVMLFDDRSFFLSGYDSLREQFSEREQVYRQTGLVLLGQYPLSRYMRIDGNVAFIDREFDNPSINENGELVFRSVSDQFPTSSLSMTRDSVQWRQWGPHNGTRWKVTGLYGYDLDDGGTLTRNIEFDGRLYAPISRRSELALRLFLGKADGTRPSFFTFGGHDTLRGIPARSLAGNRAGFLNVEWRFPLIDRLDMPFLSLSNIRGRFFIDIGAAWYEGSDGQEFNFYGEPGFTFIGEKEVNGVIVGDSGRLKDGLSSYGFGFSMNIFGMPMHWDFVKRWDLKDTFGDTSTSFWIGYKF